MTTRKKPGKDDFDTSPAAVSQWVGDLPIINTDKTRELLDQALRQINALDISPLDRYTAVELLAPPVLCVTDALKSKFLGKQVPLQDAQLASARQCLELYNLMATAYAIMAADLGRMTGKQPRLATAIHRAMRYLSEALLTNYQIYLQYPAGLWKSLHTLYTAAEKEGMTTRDVTDTTLPSPAKSTIDTVYKQILLLSLACPYRLRQKEIRHVYSALLEWAVACHLSRGTDKSDNGLFSVHLLSDDPPSYRTSGSDSHLDAYWRVLDTSGLDGLLRTAVAEPRTSGARNGIENKDNLQRLMLAWGVMPKRRFSRHPSVKPVNLVVGLDSIHRLTETRAALATPQPVDQEEELHDELYLQDPTFEGTTSFRTHSFKDIIPDVGSRINALRDNAATRPSAPAQIESWKIADMSAGGYCLILDSTEPTSVRVGDLVALQIPVDNTVQDWYLGVIRRVKYTRERGLELGLQMLSPGGRPVWTGICRDGISPTTRMRGILLPELRSIHQSASLLLPALPFRVGSTSILEYEGHRETVTLTQQLENTGIFGQYYFTPEENS